MEEVIVKIDAFSGFVLCEDASPPGTEPTVFHKAMKVKEIRAFLATNLAKTTEKFPGKKVIQRLQREEHMRTRYIRVGRMPGTQLHIFLFLRDESAIFAKDRYEPVPLSLLPFFHKAFKLPHFTASVEERGEKAFILRSAETADGFQFPTADARFWLDRYRKSQGIPKKRAVPSSPVSREAKPLKKVKRADGSSSSSLFAVNSPEEYERRKKQAVQLGLRVLSNPKSHDLLDLADLEDGNDSFEVMPGSHLGKEARPLSAEDFSAFSQPPMNNYFINMASGVDPVRTKMMTKSKMLWKQGESVWSPSTMVSVVARSEPRMRNFDATIRSVLEKSKIASGLNITTDPFAGLVSGRERDNDSDGSISEEDLFAEDGTINDEALLLKNVDTLESLQAAIMQLSLEAYLAKLFTTV